jgi:hypothetical protein
MTSSFTRTPTYTRTITPTPTWSYTPTHTGTITHTGTPTVSPTATLDTVVYLYLGANQFEIPGPPLTIDYGLQSPGRLKLRVLNIHGMVIRHLADGYMGAGSWTTNWDGRDDQGVEATTGVYLVTLRYERRTEIKKVLVIRR